MMQISIEDKPRPDDCDFVRNRLHEHNATIVGPDNYAPLAIFVRDDTGSIRGGLLGETFIFSALILACRTNGSGLERWDLKPMPFFLFLGSPTVLSRR